MVEFRTSSPEGTISIAKDLGSLLKPGDILCLNGDLGAGKTAFTNGIGAALEVEGFITSPTFTIVNEYQGRLPLYHFDVYRIGSSEEMYDIGFEEYLNGDGVVVIEWSHLIEDIIPKSHISVDIRKDVEKGSDERIITLEFIGERYSERKKLYENTCS